MSNQLQMMPEYHKNDSEGLVETFVKGFRELGRFFGKKEKKESVTGASLHEAISTAQPVYESYEKNITIEGLSIPESFCNHITSFYSQSKIYKVDYETLFNHVPSLMVSKVVAYLPASPADVTGKTYEEIMRLHIEFAKDVNNSYVKAVDSLLRVCIGWGGIQRTSLCVIWANLLYTLFSKFTSTITSEERNRIARGGIALAIGTTIAIVQYFHKSPVGITNYLRLLYEGYNNVRDWCNQHFSYRIPDVLCLESPRKEFALMTNDEKKTVGQMLNMVYTFRIGDMYLDICSRSSSKNYIRDETILAIIAKDVSPLPQRNELKKLYKLYTNEDIYNL